MQTQIKPTRLFTLMLASLLFIIGSKDSYSQTIPIMQRVHYINKYKTYLKTMVNQYTTMEQPFVIGRDHQPINNPDRHPYLYKNWKKGTILFNDATFPVENIKYDIEKDKLIYLLKRQDFSMSCISLDENFIRQFTINSSTFRLYDNLRKKTEKIVKAGYYQVVWDGKLKFLIRTEKQSVIDYGSKNLEYKSTTTLFLVKDGVLIKFSSLSKLAKQLPDKKKEIKKFISENHLRLKQEDYSSAYKILKYYESL